VCRELTTADIGDEKGDVAMLLSVEFIVSGKEFGCLGCISQTALALGREKKNVGSY